MPGATVTRKGGKRLGISGTDEKDEAVRVVFRLNIAKHDLRFEPGGAEET